MQKLSLKVRFLNSLNKKSSFSIQAPDSIYFMGICGTAMASLAVYLKQQGFFVSGSDQNIYPPMSLMLKQEGIPIFNYSSHNIDSSIQLIVVGNVISSSHIEIEKAKSLNIPVLSFPEFLQQSLLSQTKNIVITGTHGKSTSAALMVYTAQQAHCVPGFFVGGIPNDFNCSFNSSESSNYFVIEGDEYDTSFFAKHAKFFYYNPTYALLTGIEFDHGDIYKDLTDIKKVFLEFIQKIPIHGALIAYADNESVREILPACKAPVLTYGLKYGDFRIQNRSIQNNFQTFKVLGPNQKNYELTVPLLGQHNALNALGVFILAKHLKWREKKILSAFKTFKGLKRRLEFKFEFQKAKIFEDFAHHPTAIQAGLSALKERYPKNRLLVLFEPRSFTARLNVFHKNYVLSFDPADLIFIAQPYESSKIVKEKRLSVEKLVEDLRKKGKEAFYYSDFKTLEQELKKHINPGDIVVFMSSGAFGHILEHLQNLN